MVKGTSKGYQFNRVYWNEVTTIINYTTEYDIFTLETIKTQ